jgi:protoheme IX farnesyltransferase
LSAVFAAGAVWTLCDRQDAAGNSETGDRPAKLLFRYSLIYLAVIFVAIAADRLVA